MKTVFVSLTLLIGSFAIPQLVAPPKRVAAWESVAKPPLPPVASAVQSGQPDEPKCVGNVCPEA